MNLTAGIEKLPDRQMPAVTGAGDGVVAASTLSIGASAETKGPATNSWIS